MSRFWSPAVYGLSPYVPGEQPKQDGVVKLNTNENPYPPSRRVLAAITATAERLRLYPDPRASLLRETIATLYKAGLKARGVLVRHFDKPRIADFLRITVGTEEQCSRLIAEVRGLI